MLNSNWTCCFSTALVVISTFDSDMSSRPRSISWRMRFSCRSTGDILGTDLPNSISGLLVTKVVMVGQVNLLEEIQRHATLRAISIRYLVRQQLLPQHAMQRLPRPPTLLGENVSEQARSVNGVVDTRSGGDDAGDCIEGHPLVRGNRRRQLHKITAQSALTSKTSGRHAVNTHRVTMRPPHMGAARTQVAAKYTIRSQAPGPTGTCDLSLACGVVHRYSTYYVLESSRDSRQDRLCVTQCCWWGVRYRGFTSRVGADARLMTTLTITDDDVTAGARLPQITVTRGGVSPVVISKSGTPSPRASRNKLTGAMHFTMSHLKTIVGLEIVAFMASTALSIAIFATTWTSTSSWTMRAMLGSSVTLIAKSFVYMRGPAGDKEYALNGAYMMHMLGMVAVAIVVGLTGYTWYTDVFIRKVAVSWMSHAFFFTTAYGWCVEVALAVIMYQLISQYVMSVADKVEEPYEA